jgi:hypothetical protein
LNAEDSGLTDIRMPIYLRAAVSSLDPKVPWGRLPDPVRSKIPTAAMPAPPSPRVAGLYTFGDGQSPSSPQDVRLTSFVQSDDRSYLSPSLEISTYASGSSQVQEIKRTASSLVIGHDALGRRSFELDSRDPVRYARTLDSYHTPGEGPDCLAMQIAHERLHIAIRAGVIPADYGGALNMRLGLDASTEEVFVDEAVDASNFFGCFNCVQIGGRNFGVGSRRTGLITR